MNGDKNKGEEFKKLVTLSDGKYWLPVRLENIYTAVTEIYPNGIYEDVNRVFGTGKRVLNIRFDYECFENDDVEDAVELWIAVYRIGQAEPVWVESIRLDEEESRFSVSADTELQAGGQFIFISNVGMDNSMASSEMTDNCVMQLPMGIRYDFAVEPSGDGLVHPELKELRLNQHSFSEWKEKHLEHYIESITIDAELVFEKPFDWTGNFLEIEVFDESLNRIARSGYFNDKGHADLIGYFPIMDGEFRFIILHNLTPIFCGSFVSSSGICHVDSLQECGIDSELVDVLATPYKKYQLKFNSTAYGRRLRFLEDIVMWGDDDTVLEGDRLERELERLGMNSDKEF